MKREVVIDEGKLLENVLTAAKKVMEWSWDDCDQEPTRDIAKLQAAIDDVEDFRRVRKVADL